MNHEMNIHHYEGLVNYLGVVLGSQYEILLQDMQKRVLLAVANGYITLRVKGGPITAFAEKIDEDQIWKNVDYLTNLKCKTASDHLILTSIYFIKNENELQGLLCINYDTTQYNDENPHPGDLHNLLNIFSHRPEVAAFSVPADQAIPEQLDSQSMSSISINVASMVDQVVHEYCEKNNVFAAHLKHADKQIVINRLYNKDIFKVKGSISYVAKILNSSETTIYRYLRGSRESK